MNLRQEQDLFFRIIDACYLHGHFKMTNRVYEMMLRFNIPASNQIKLRFYEHSRKEIKSKGNKGKDTVQQDTNASKRSQL